MSRIEEALRRAGIATASGTIPTGEGDGTPDWTFPREGVTGDDGRRGAPREDLTLVHRPSVTALLGDERAQPLAELRAEWSDRLAVSPSASPMLVEQFRRLAATLYQAQGSGNVKVVMVTSAMPGDGKTLTALNLALVLSESYRRRVLLIDADLRHPSISNLTGLPPSTGLSEGLKARSEQKLPVLRITERLTLLPAGHPDPDPMSSLTSSRMQRIIEEASSRFDWVIMDAPPVGPVADASLLAAMTDAVLIVIRANQTQFGAVQQAIDSIGREKIFGVVLNGIDSIEEEYTRQYGAYYSTGLRT